MNPPVIVLGCPRSGTSLIAGILHQSGIAMSCDTFAGKTKQNPTGFWEDPLIVAMNDRIFQDVNTGHLEPPPRNIKASMGWLDIIRKRMIERAQGGVWGFKDPRVIFLWSFYETMIKDEFDSAKIIATHRNPLHIVRSWITHGRIGNTETARGLWLVSEYENRMGEVYKSGWPILHIAFEDWWHKPDEQREWLSEFVGSELDFSLFDEGLWRS